MKDIRWVRLVFAAVGLVGACSSSRLENPTLPDGAYDGATGDLDGGLADRSFGDVPLADGTDAPLDATTDSSADAATDRSLADVPPDAAGDGMLTDVADASGLATVITLIDSVPRSGIDVVFHAPDGTVTAHVVSDTSGTASSTVIAGSIVTMAYTRESDGELILRSFFGVDPGETVELLLGSGLSAASMVIGTLRVALGERYPGATTYDVQNGCFASSSIDDTTATDVVLDVRTRCLGPLGLTVYAVAHDGGADPLAYTLLTDVPFASGSATASLAGWRTDWTTVPITVTNTLASNVYDDGSFGIGDWTGGLVFGASTAPGFVAVPDGTTTRSEAWFPSGINPTWFSVSAHLSFGGRPDPWSFTRIVDARSGRPTGAMSFDVPTDLLGRLTTVSLNTSTPGRPSLVWAASPSPITPTSQSVRLDWTTEGGSHLWAADVPVDALAVQMPELPVALDRYRPTATSSYTSWGAFRHQPDEFALDSLYRNSSISDF